ncbi:hypothetical protein [Streptomyces sp. NPDC050848]|uniref:hypothetical protein n=1 Tax=Streptomyces sp. NPDC050848 TaxID=3155791 RepID=UPI0033CF6A5B
MTVLSAKERGDMAEALLPIAAHLVTLVHGDGGPRDVHQALARLDATQKDALLIVLAGLVDPDQPMGRALGWLDYDEHGRMVVPAWGDRARLRDLAPEPELEEEDERYVDEAAVRKYVLGIQVTVTPRERLEAVRVCLVRGMNYPDIDAMHGLKRGSTSTFISRTRKAYELRGEVFPTLVRPDAAPVLTEQDVITIRERSVVHGHTDLEIGMSFGLDAHQVGDICRGRRYPNYGGPIREPKVNKPGANSRTIWAGKANLAQAS